MTLQRLMPLICCAMLSACATDAAVAPAGKSAPTIASAMADADAAILSGHSDKAYIVLKQAGTAFPNDKTPWVRMAQMRFDSTDYGQAIVDALQALKRDPEDTLAHSIVAVSGLRVTSKALADLSQKNNLTGNVRTEAQVLAKLLRTNLNEDNLLAGNRGATVRRDSASKKSASAAPAAAPAKGAAATSDPFGGLK